MFSSVSEIPVCFSSFRCFINGELNRDYSSCRFAWMNESTYSRGGSTVESPMPLCLSRKASTYDIRWEIACLCWSSSICCLLKLSICSIRDCSSCCFRGERRSVEAKLSALCVGFPGLDLLTFVGVEYGLTIDWLYARCDCTNDSSSWLRISHSCFYSALRAGAFCSWIDSSFTFSVRCYTCDAAVIVFLNISLTGSMNCV